MTALEILEKYLYKEISYANAIKRTRFLMQEDEEHTRYTPIIRCIESWELDNHIDFCGHLRQALCNFNGAISIGKEVYKTIHPNKARYGFLMSGKGPYEINIEREMLPDIDDLKSVYSFEKRKNNPLSISNGAVYRYFNYRSFTSLQQKMMMYFVANMKSNQTLLACLPTGGGKSFTWQFSVFAEIFSGCVIVIVPTVALAINHETSAKNKIMEIDGFSKTARAYYSELGHERKELIFDELRNNKLSLLFISPEALLSEDFKGKIINAAKLGRIGALIVDEVHLVVSWGMKFRPEFQLLPSLRSEIEKISPNGIKTILLSATITEHDRNTISRLFGKNGIIEYRADELRPEFEFFVHECFSNEERNKLLHAIVDQAPKPMIIYTSTPKIAKHYYKLLQEVDYTRIALFTGETPSNERQRIISDWNKDLIDIIVATSAFGMGVDKTDIRTIVITYIPESISRFYQEVGRAGRDGYSALVYWLYCHNSDDDIVKYLTDTSLLTGKRLSERWDSLYRDAKRTGADRVLISMNSMPEDMRGNLTGKKHENWNKDAVLLLYREGIIDIVDLKMITNQDYEIEVILNNIPVLESKSLLEAYIEEFREAERISINEDKESVYSMLNYKKDECFSTFFTKVFPHATELCSGCPYCRGIERTAYSYPQIIYGNGLGQTKHNKENITSQNMYITNFRDRGLSLITYQGQLENKEKNQLVEFLIRFGIECIVSEDWDTSVLELLIDFERANYLLLKYDEFEKIDYSWINGIFVFFMPSNQLLINKVYHYGKQINSDGIPVVFIANSSTRIEDEEKMLKEITNYNVILENIIEGESL